MNQHGWFFRKDIGVQILHKIFFGIAHPLIGSVFFRVGTMPKPFAAEFQSVFFKVMRDSIRDRLYGAVSVRASYDILPIRSPCPFVDRIIP